MLGVSCLAETAPASATIEAASIYRSMLRIFRGERTADDAVQPGQPTQEQREQPKQEAAGAKANPPSPASDLTPPRAATEDSQAQAPDDSQTQAPDDSQAQAPDDSQAQPPEGQERGFLERARIRRRARFLSAARELAYRDLGGLVFDLHRFGQRNDAVVKAKLDTLSRIDSELRALQAALSERQSVTVLREAGVAACLRCAAIHGSGDRFCPTCGLAVDQAERPIAASAPTPGAPPIPTPPIPTQPVPTPPIPLAQAPFGADQTPSTPSRTPSAPLQAPADPIQTPPAPPTDADPASSSKPAAGTDETQEPQTEVIRSGRARPRAAQRTVAFDPVTPAAGDHQDRGDDDPRNRGSGAPPAPGSGAPLDSGSGDTPDRGGEQRGPREDRA
jgi:hypothetical protein